METREVNRKKVTLSRQRAALSRERTYLKKNTDWEGFVNIRSKDKMFIYYGETDEELLEKFKSGRPLMENVPEKSTKKMKKIDVCKVMEKVATCDTRTEAVPESPDPSPSKVPGCVRDMLPFLSERQVAELSNLADHVANNIIL